MDYKVLGWLQIIGGILALLFSGGIGVSGMMGMMGFYGGYNMMAMGSGLSVSLLAILFIITGAHYVTKTEKKGIKPKRS